MAVGDTTKSVRDYLSDLGIAGGDPLTSTQLSNLMEAYGQAPTQRFFTPEQQMRQFTAAAPRWQQDALWNMYQPLSTQFGLSRIGAPQQGTLGQEGYLPAYGAAGIGDTFADYLGQYGGGQMTPMTRNEMISRGQQAAAFGRMSPMALGGMLGSDRADEAMYGYYTYGGGPQAAQNQYALARQLALTPRISGDIGYAAGQAIPQYGMAMQNAISGALQDIQASRQAVAPDESFLQWYLNQITGGTGQVGVPSGAVAAGAQGYNIPARGDLTPGSDAWRQSQLM